MGNLLCGTEGQKNANHFSGRRQDVFDGHFTHKNLNVVCVAKTAAAKVTVFVHKNHTTYSLYPVTFFSFNTQCLKMNLNCLILQYCEWMYDLNFRAENPTKNSNLK